MVQILRQNNIEVHRVLTLEVLPIPFLTIPLDGRGSFLCNIIHTTRVNKKPFSTIYYGSIALISVFFDLLNL